MIPSTTASLLGLGDIIARIVAEQSSVITLLQREVGLGGISRVVTGQGITTSTFTLGTFSQWVV